MKKSSLSPLDTLRRLYFITVPLAIGLVSFHGIATLTGGTVIAEPPELNPGPVAGVVAPTSPQVVGTVGADATAPATPRQRALDAPDIVSDERRAEVMAQAKEQQFHFKLTNGAATAANPHQALTVRCADGATEFAHRPAQPAIVGLTNQPPRWQVSFTAERLEADDTVLPLGGAGASPSISDARVSTELTQGCTEWFENRAAGVKHGFTIRSLPGSQHPAQLSMVLDVETGSPASYDAEREAVLFLNESGNPFAIYRGLHVFDNTGRELDSSMSLSPSALAGHHEITLSCNTAGAEFPLTIDPDFATQIGGSLMASDGTAGDGYGTATAVESNIHVVGAPNNHELNPPDPVTYGGKVYIYEKDLGGAENWGERTTVTVPDGMGGAVTDRFGEAVSLWHDTDSGAFYLAVGAPGFSGGGAVFIFERNEGGANNWGFKQKIQPNGLSAGDEFGNSLDFLSPEIAIGARNHNVTGAVFIFALIALVFVLQQTLFPPSGSSGTGFGFCVRGQGDRVAVGMPDGTYTEPGPTVRTGGIVFLFSRNPAVSLLFTSIVAFFSLHGVLGDRFGHAVAINQSTLAVGAPEVDGPPPGTSGLINSGAVFVFQFIAALVWSHLFSHFGTITGGLFGAALALNFFHDLVVGSPGALTSKGVVAGLVFVFLFSLLSGYGTPEQVEPSTFQDPGMAFGTSIALLGTTLFVMAALYNGGQGAMFRFLLAATVLTFFLWQQLFWSLANITDPTKQHIYGPFGDYNGDGLRNILEYAMGLLPIYFNAGLLLTMLAGGGVYFTFQASLAVTAVSLLLQYSTTLGLAAWFPVAGLLTATLGILHAGIATNLMFFSLPAFITVAMFFRLQAQAITPE